MNQGTQPLKPKWLFYGLSFLVPIAGIIIGAIFMSKPDAEAKDFGKRCLIAAVTYFVAACCCIIAYISVYIVLAIGLRGMEGFNV
jgi:hypothetical protein